MAIPDSRRGTYNKPKKPKRSEADEWNALMGRDSSGKPKPGTNSGGGYYPHGYNYRDAAASRQAMGADMGDLGGGGGGGGGRGRGGGYGYGGGYDPEAARQAQLAAQRTLVEQLYNDQLGRMGTQRDEAMAALPGYLSEALGRLGTINTQNVQAGRQARSMIDRDRGSAEGQLRSALGGLTTDLGAQGVDAQGIAGAGRMYQADAGARGAAASGFNERLNAIMALQYGDQQAGAAQINQGAQANTQNNYQQALAELQRQRTQQLMGLV